MPNELLIVVEERSKWPGGEWSEWSFDGKYQVPCGNLKREVGYCLAMRRRRVADEEDNMGIQFEYRARIEKCPTN